MHDDSTVKLVRRADGGTTILSARTGKKLGELPPLTAPNPKRDAFLACDRRTSSEHVNDINRLLTKPRAGDSAAEITVFALVVGLAAYGGLRLACDFLFTR